MFPQELIRAKRDGTELSTDQIETFVGGLIDGSFSDAQVSAFAMAVFFRGMTMPERIALTRAMTRSGHVLDWSQHEFDAPLVDKHSTGGVGDKVSLILAPILAACGCIVPMISGRGLGHTGGTLDKLDAIGGYNTAPDIALFGDVLKSAGCAIIGQTADIAPADRRFYAIRDVTATVESIPLITASILSKKLAAGLDRLVIDVKFGSGAFADSFEMAEDLAQSLVEVSGGAGLPCSALLTDMNQVLGWTAGNALETREAIEHLMGTSREPRLHEVTVALGAELLRLVGIADSDEAARARIDDALASGAAAERFDRMNVALGGPSDLLTNLDAHLPLGPIERPVLPARDGTLARMDVRRIGLAVMELGGGRRHADDVIDYGVGFSSMCRLGDAVGPTKPVCTVHARSKADAEAGIQAVLAAIDVQDGPLETRSAIAKRVAPRPPLKTT